MAKEPKVDRVKFQADFGAYFRNVPAAPFLSFDGGSLKLEQPETLGAILDGKVVGTRLPPVAQTI